MSFLSRSGRLIRKAEIDGVIYVTHAYLGGDSDNLLVKTNAEVVHDSNGKSFKLFVSSKEWNRQVEGRLFAGETFIREAVVTVDYAYGYEAWVRKDNEELFRLVNTLCDCPVLDEDRWREAQENEIWSQWGDWGRQEIINLLPEGMRDWAEKHSSYFDALYRESCSTESGYPYYSNESAVFPQDEFLLEKLCVGLEEHCFSIVTSDAEQIEKLKMAYALTLEQGLAEDESFIMFGRVRISIGRIHDVFFGLAECNSVLHLIAASMEWSGILGGSLSREGDGFEA